MSSSIELGQAMYDLVVRLFPICRSITGEGLRESLRIIGEHLPLRLHEVPSGSKALDWKVPKEWNIHDAYVANEQGERVIDFKKNNLHVLNYSIPVDVILSRKELDEHLYSIPEQPDAIPHRTSFYAERWGFSLSHRERERLPEGMYRAVIHSDLKDGSLTYGELMIRGKTSKEIFLSTYVCHPSMANDNLSGPVIATFLAKWLREKPRKHTYRIIFIPETIGALVYLSRNLKTMKKNMIAGFILTCMGDERAYSFMPSRQGNTVADRAALHVLKTRHPEFRACTYLMRGSDERQYCAPGVDLPVVSIMRSKYYDFPEYHTSRDDLALVTPAGLQGSFEAMKECIELLEQNERYRAVCLGEPQLGKRGLYPKDSHKIVASDLMNVLSYADGRDLLGIAEATGIVIPGLIILIKELLEAKLIAKVATRT